MERYIMYGYNKEELTKELCQQLGEDSKEYQKYIKHKTAFFQSIYVSLLVLSILTLLEILFATNDKELLKILVKFVLLQVFMFVVGFYYKHYLYLEDKPTFHFKPRSFQSKSEIPIN